MRATDLRGLPKIDILAFKAVFEQLDLGHGGQEFFLLPLSRNGMRKYLTHQFDPGDQIVRPGAGLIERSESDRADNPAANAKRDAEMRIEAGFAKVFGFT